MNNEKLMKIKLLNKKEIRSHYIEKIEDLSVKIYPNDSEFLLSFEYSEDDYMTFKFKVVEIGKLTPELLFASILDVIKFDNTNDNFVSYNPSILIDYLDSICDQLTDEFYVQEIPQKGFKYYKFVSVQNEKGELKFIYHDQVSNVLIIKGDKVYKDYTSKLAYIDHEKFISEKMAGVDIENLKYLFYGDKND